MALNRLLYRGVMSVLVVFGFGCAHTSDDHSSRLAWVRDGSIVISRNLPTASVNPPSGALLGFLPTPGTQRGRWLSLNTSEQTIKLLEGDKELASAKWEGGSDVLRSGIYKLVHKQRNPLWSAPDQYFTRRSLPVPANGARDRLRRGALGDFVLYIDKETPIHSGPVWMEEIGGIKVAESDLSKFYYQIDVGSLIEVQ